jgi:hypothetical protein
MPKSKLECALFYAQKMGWPVVPLFEIRDGCCTCRLGKKCGRSSGKHPRTQHGLNDATTDENQIREWWDKWRNANIGVRTGRISGIIVIDVDPRNGANETSKVRRQELGPLPRTLKASSGGGRKHYVFQHPDFEVRSDNQGTLLGPGLDVLSNGHLFVAPESNHLSGKEYRWVKGHLPDDIPPAALPDAWLERLGPRIEPLVRKVRGESTTDAVGEGPTSSDNTKEQPPKAPQTPAQGETGWYTKLPVEKQSEVIKYAALHIAKNSKLFELTRHGGNYNQYLRLVLAITRSGVPDAEQIFVEAASTAKEADSEENLRNFFRSCAQATKRPDGITVATLLHKARECGVEFHKWKAFAESTGSVALTDFFAYMPLHRYSFAPSRELWPASSVNSRLGPVKEDKSASAWLDENRPVEQMTWAPGLPMLIRDRLISDGGWIKRPGVSCFNLYRPPTIKLGNPAHAQRWLDHVHKVFGDDDEHIVKWLAYRRQRPREKINHGLVLGGSQGIGKDTLLEPAKYAVGPWNFLEVSPQHLLGPFNGFAKSVILRVSEARDLGGVDRFRFYDHLKTYTAAPPDVLRVNEKNLREHYVRNCCGIIITTNHKTDGIYLPSDDRRHFVSWSNLTKDDFDEDYWTKMWKWYADGGIYHVAAYLAALDISSFDPKAPPPKTQAFWDIVAANTAPEDAELADVLDKMDNPYAVTINQISNHAAASFQEWINDRRSRRAIPHRLEKCGYVQVRNNNAKDGLWVINGSRHVVYTRSDLSAADRFKAASELARREGWSVK